MLRVECFIVAACHKTNKAVDTKHVVGPSRLCELIFVDESMAFIKTAVLSLAVERDIRKKLKQNFHNQKDERIRKHREYAWKKGETAENKRYNKNKTWRAVQ